MLIALALGLPIAKTPPVVRPLLICHQPVVVKSAFAVSYVDGLFAPTAYPMFRCLSAASGTFHVDQLAASKLLRLRRCLYVDGLVV